MTEADAKEIVIDFSEPFSGKTNELSANRIDDILKGIGLDSHVSDDKFCETDKNPEGTPIYLEGNVQTGRFFPETQNQQELVSLTLTRCKQPSWFRENYLVLIVDGQISSHFKFACNYDTMLLPDQRTPTKQVILGRCGGGGQGETDEYARIYGVEAGKLLQLRDLGPVSSDNCGDNKRGEQTYTIMTVSSKGGISTKTAKKPCAPINP
jgi:hypothetical protein